MHDAVMVGVITNTFLVLALAVILFFVANTATVSGASEIEDWRYEDDDKLFAGNPQTEEEGCYTICTREGDLSNRKVYSFHFQGNPDVQVNLDYEASRVQQNPCVQTANVDIYIYNSSGHQVYAYDDPCDSGIIDFTEQLSGTHTFEVIGTHGASIPYSFRFLANH